MLDLYKKTQSTEKRPFSRQIFLRFAGTFLAGILVLLSVLCIRADAADLTGESMESDEGSLPSDSEEIIDGGLINYAENSDTADSSGDPDEIYSEPQDHLPQDDYIDPEEPSVYTWPESGIVARLPVPDCRLDNLWFNDDMPNQFFANADVPFSFFEHYLDLCKGMGYTLDETESSSYSEDQASYMYLAYDSEGYRLELSYIGKTDTGTGYMDFSLQSPRSLGTLVWPEQGPGLLLPVPPTTVGSVGGMPEMFLIVYLGDMSKELYHSYIEECKDAGFTLNSSETDTAYSAEDQDGIQFSSSYDGGGFVFLQILDPDQKWITRTQSIHEENGDETAETEGSPFPGATAETDMKEDESILPGTVSDETGTADDTALQSGADTCSENAADENAVDENAVDENSADENAADENSANENAANENAANENAAQEYFEDYPSAEEPADSENKDAHDFLSPDPGNRNAASELTKADPVYLAEEGSPAARSNTSNDTSPVTGKKDSWLIQPSALQGEHDKNAQRDSSESSKSHGSPAESVTDSSASWPGNPSRAAVSLTVFLSICTVLAGAITKKRAFVRSLQFNDNK